MEKVNLENLKSFGLPKKVLKITFLTTTSIKKYFSFTGFVLNKVLSKTRIILFQNKVQMFKKSPESPFLFFNNIYF